jgi:hypothetical protein
MTDLSFSAISKTGCKISILGQDEFQKKILFLEKKFQTNLGIEGFKYLHRLLTDTVSVIL